MKLIKRAIAIAGFLSVALAAPAKVDAAAFSGIYAFGDSLSDLGRASAATFGAVPPYPQGNGRFSNGLLWIEYLAQRLGMAVNPATNFAIGGATTGALNTIKDDLPPALPSINDFVGLEQQITSFVASNPVADPNALYTLWAGANDYLGAGVVNPAGPIANLLGDVATLSSIGARHILVVNLPALGDLPTTQGTANSAGLNLLTQFHNQNLSAQLDILRQANPNLDLTLLDVGSLFAQAVANPASFGFANVTDGCLLVACTNPDEYLFWDTIHPTTTTHRLIGNLAYQSLSVPEGSTIWGLFAAGTLILFMVKKAS